ncbi:MAG: hypothetical protein HY773_01165 [Candidatus Terrybacteria bacterium]|nr:hypothetical protein [Candidatus Terrybacteria bacterium]
MKEQKKIKEIKKQTEELNQNQQTNQQLGVQSSYNLFEIISPKNQDVWEKGKEYEINWNQNKEVGLVAVRLVSQSSTSTKILIASNEKGKGDFINFSKPPIIYKPSVLIKNGLYNVLICDVSPWNRGVSQDKICSKSGIVNIVDNQ